MVNYGESSNMASATYLELQVPHAAAGETTWHRKRQKLEIT